LVSIFEDLSRPIEDLIEWGRRQPHSLETKQEPRTVSNRHPLHAAGHRGSGHPTAHGARPSPDSPSGPRDGHPCAPSRQRPVGATRVAHARRCCPHAHPLAAEWG
ncbi:hypothetical protein ABZ748_31060, partial [Streptomyces pseudogriseolus]